jgi:hypothetical protein
LTDEQQTTEQVQTTEQTGEQTQAEETQTEETQQPDTTTEAVSDPRDAEMQALRAELAETRKERQQYLEAISRFAPQQPQERGPDINAIIDKGLGEGSDAGRVIKEVLAAQTFQHERELQSLRQEMNQRTGAIQMETHEQRVVNDLVESGDLTKAEIPALREKVMQRAEQARKRGMVIDLESAYQAEAFKAQRARGFKAGDDEARKRAELTKRRGIATAPSTANPTGGIKATMTEEQKRELAREMNAKYPGKAGMAYEKYMEALKERGAL